MLKIPIKYYLPVISIYSPFSLLLEGKAESVKGKERYFCGQIWKDRWMRLRLQSETRKRTLGLLLQLPF